MEGHLSPLQKSFCLGVFLGSLGLHINVLLSETFLWIIHLPMIIPDHFLRRPTCVLPFLGNSNYKPEYCITHAGATFRNLPQFFLPFTEYLNFCLFLNNFLL